MVEYLIILYAAGTVTTIIGFADMDAARQAFDDACEKHHAHWGYLFRGDGEIIESFKRHS